MVDYLNNWFESLQFREFKPLNKMRTSLSFQKDFIRQFLIFAV